MIYGVKGYEKPRLSYRGSSFVLETSKPGSVFLPAVRQVGNHLSNAFVFGPSESCVKTDRSEVAAGRIISVALAIHTFRV